MAGKFRLGLNIYIYIYMTRLASALLVAKRVMNLGIMAWCVPHSVALEGRAYCATMPCVTQSLTRQLQLALPLSKRKGPYSQAITGGLPIFSSVTDVGRRTLPWTLPSPTLSRVTPDQIQEQHLRQAMLLQLLLRTR